MEEYPIDQSDLYSLRNFEELKIFFSCKIRRSNEFSGIITNQFTLSRVMKENYLNKGTLSGTGSWKCRIMKEF